MIRAAGPWVLFTDLDLVTLLAGQISGVPAAMTSASVMERGRGTALGPPGAPPIRRLLARRRAELRIGPQRHEQLPAPLITVAVTASTISRNGQAHGRQPGGAPDRAGGLPEHSPHAVRAPVLPAAGRSVPALPVRELSSHYPASPPCARPLSPDWI